MRQAKIVELRFFGGLSLKEVAFISESGGILHEVKRILHDLYKGAIERFMLVFLFSTGRQWRQTGVVFRFDSLRKDFST